MGDIEETVKVSDLSNYEQKVVEGYSSLVKELFSIKSCSGTGENEEDVSKRKFNKDIKHFLETVITIFSITPNKTSLCFKDESNVDDIILRDCIGKFRATFRKQFRGVHYLTSKHLDECNESALLVVARATFKNLVSKFGVTNEQKEILKCNLIDQCEKEFGWIKKVNLFKRMKILDSIKAEISEGFKSDIEMQFASLYTGSGTDFYEEQELAIKYTEHLINAVDCFKEQIPFEEEEHILLEMTTGFEKELKKNVVEDLMQRNSSNKRTARLILEARVDRSVTTYENNMSAYMENTPLQGPTIFLEQHEKLKEEHMPIRGEKSKEEGVGYEELQIEYLNLYHKRIHENFSKQLEIGRTKALNNLINCRNKTKNISKRYAREIQQCFEEFKISKDHADKLIKKIERDIMETTEEIKDSSLGNSNNIDIVLAKSKPVPILTKSEKEQEEAEISRILEKMKQTFIDQMKKLGITPALKVSKLKMIKSFQTEIRTKCVDDHAYDNYIKELRNFMETEMGKEKHSIANVSQQQSEPAVLPKQPQLVTSANGDPNWLLQQTATLFFVLPYNQVTQGKDRPERNFRIISKYS